MAANPLMVAAGRWSTASLVLTDGTSVIVPGVTSISLRNNADNADNLIITDAGAVTFRSTVGGITTLTATTLAGTLSTASQPNVTGVGTLTGTVALASGAVLSWNSGNVTLTHSAGTLTISGSNPKLVTYPASNAKAGFNLPHGSAPTSPADGDVWTTTAGLFVQVNGAPVGPLS